MKFRTPIELIAEFNEKRAQERAEYAAIVVSFEEYSVFVSDQEPDPVEKLSELFASGGKPMGIILQASEPEALRPQDKTVIKTRAIMFREWETTNDATFVAAHLKGICVGYEQAIIGTLPGAEELKRENN